MINTDFPVTLRAVLETKYFPLNLKIRSDDTKKHYRIAIGNFEKFLGHEPTISDLSDDAVIGMMKMLMDRDKAAATVNDRRTRINALWTWLCKKGRCAIWPTNQEIDEPEPDPQAFTREEMKRLIDAADRFVASEDRKNLSKWWRAIFHAVWDSGARTGEILSMRWEWIDWTTGNIRVPAKYRKGKKKSAVYRFKTATLERLRDMGVEDSGRIFGLRCQETFHVRYKKLLKRAGFERSRKNGLQKWRRTFATYIEKLGGDSSRELLHGNVSTTKRHYLDKAVLNVPQNHLLFPLGSVEE